MERAEVERLAAVEDRHWWFGGLHANLLAAWRAGAAAEERPALLDLGCGTGGFLARLAAALPKARLYGLDRDAAAAALARGKSGALITVGDAAAAPFAAAGFDGVFSADLLCHRGVDEAATLAEIYHALRRGGLLVLNLPAYRWLYSAHDRAVDNARRYGRRRIAALLADAGFVRVRSRYWNSFLFPLMVLHRKLGRPSRPAASDVALLAAPLDRVFAACLALERGLWRGGVALPFGGSILTTAVKP